MPPFTQTGTHESGARRGENGRVLHEETLRTTLSRCALRLRS